MDQSALLTRLLRRIFARQRLDVLAWLNRGGLQGRAGAMPSLDRYLPVMMDAVMPVIVDLWRQGGERAARRISRKVREQGTHKEKGFAAAPRQNHERTSTGVAFAGRFPRREGSGILKDFAPTPRFEFAFNLFRPETIERIRAAVFQFCAATNATANAEIADAIGVLRTSLARGVEQGQTTLELNARVGRIFTDPYRAARIAQTETSRAVNMGSLLAAKESGVCTGKKWLASSDACDLCLSIAAKGEIPLDQPFYIHPRGGPYAVVMTPPAHPHCFCAQTEVVADAQAASGAGSPSVLTVPGWGRETGTRPAWERMAA